MYISRRDAQKKYNISVERLRQAEKKGKLVRVRAADVPYEQPSKTNGSFGAVVKWVYREEHVAALVGKMGADAAFVRRQQIEARVFDLLEQGVDIIEIVRRLRIDLATVERLRAVYVKEKGGFVVSGEAVRVVKTYGFELTAKTFVALLIQLLEGVRGVKPSRDRSSRFKMVVEE
jgi:hypothetical protein